MTARGPNLQIASSGVYTFNACRGIVLINANPVDVELVGVRCIGISRPATIAYRLVENQVECLVERPLSRSIVGWHMIILPLLPAVHVPTYGIGHFLPPIGVVGRHVHSL